MQLQAHMRLGVFISYSNRSADSWQPYGREHARTEIYRPDTSSRSGIEYPSKLLALPRRASEQLPIERFGEEVVL